MDSYLRQLISIEFEDRKSIVTGILIDHSKDWLLLRNNPADFVLDGFQIVRNKKIKTIFRDADYDFVEKVIRLKGIAIAPETVIPIRDLQSLLHAINQRFGLFQISKRSDKAVYVGKLKELNDEELIIDFLNPRGEWEGEMDFKLKQIRVIEFDTDYLNSLRLVLAANKG